ncbi:hypothetical protein NP493_129g02001 [Ridgeia piscesae]|uniref:LicD/FKTN/FKRP nucleotidyltransferase domain-containing protein n=1 Tax=Ridgeia piscesae TaxID=27915 RepID=A0AAD9P5I9_RIDPI|nr:hypothetical protein NP493_129g02001 [Ridgeia piscesae]
MLRWMRCSRILTRIVAVALALVCITQFFKIRSSTKNVVITMMVHNSTENTVTTTQIAVTTPEVKEVPGFGSVMTTDDGDVMRRLLRKFVQTVDAVNITYLMYGGTLLGSYRHHSIIPWDDDVDLMVDVAKMSRLRRAVASLGSAFHLYAADYRWKFYSNESKPIKGYSWHYPFLDISFYKQNAQFVFDYDPGYAGRFKYNTSAVFPLCKRPFWGMSLNAPRDTLGFLVQNYNLDICASNKYNHKIEQRIHATKAVSVKCDHLWNQFPFVFRSSSSNGTTETLKVGSTVISSIQLAPTVTSNKTQ